MTRLTQQVPRRERVVVIRQPQQRRRLLALPQQAACPAIGGHAKYGAPRHGSDDATEKFVRSFSSTAKVALSTVSLMRGGSPCG